MKIKPLELDSTLEEEVLTIARLTLDEYISSGQKPKLMPVHKRLFQSGGVFVTLKKDGHLRGCIGLVESNNQIWETIQDMTIAAAIDDPRFDKVTKGELNDIKIEVSLLSIPQEIDDYQQIEVGTHGVIIENKGTRGVFLPSVAVEFGWNLKQMLENLCLHKCYLGANCYKDPTSKIYTFIAEVFEEK